MNLAEALGHILEHENRPVAVFAGSAISKGRPAGLPDVKWFYESLASALAACSRDVGSPVDLAISLDRKTRFETLLDLLSSVLADHHPGSVRGLLVRTFNRGEPNPNHELLARLLKDQRVRLVLTTNFDDQIRKADLSIARWAEETDQDTLARIVDGVRGVGSPFPAVAHLHGSVALPQTLAAFPWQLGQPLRGPKARLLHAVQEHCAVVVVGSSMRDQDIVPLITPNTRIKGWRLGRSISVDARSSGGWGHNLAVELLEPGESNEVPSDVAAILSAWFRELDDPCQAAVVGVVLNCAGHSIDACAAFHRSLDLLRTAPDHRRMPIIHAFAGALGDAQLHGLAANALTGDPFEARYPRAAAWVGDRAFFRRHASRPIDAVDQYRRARDQLEGSSAVDDPGAALQIFEINVREVESRILAASSEPSVRRQQLLSECPSLLARCRAQLADERFRAPSYTLAYLEAEWALSQGHAAEAVRKYAEYEQLAGPWLEGHERAVGGPRRAIALAMMGRRRAAFRAWRRGLRAGRRRGSFVEIVQHLVDVPVLFGVPASWHWRARAAATRLYPIYAGLKAAAVRIFRGDILTVTPPGHR